MTATIATERPDLSGQRFDLADYVNPAFLQSVTGQRFDAGQTAFFLRDLTDIYARTFDVKYPDLKARTILPVYTGVDPGAEGFVWRQFDRTGTAEVIAAEEQSRIYSLGASYSYSIQDLRKAKMAGIPLETRKAFAARRAMEQAVEQIAFFGYQAVPGAAATQSVLGAPAALSTPDPLVMA